jgi:hypothetical protein
MMLDDPAKDGRKEIIRAAIKAVILFMVYVYFVSTYIWFLEILVLV